MSKKTSNPTESLKIPRFIITTGKFLSFISPKLATSYATKLFITPIKHKVPKRELEMDRKSIQNTIDLIQALNPNINFIFTISPVRHIKDGFVENQLSKSHLFTGLHQNLQSKIENQQSEYFPSYEIMMDELRDYRFYAEDMLHPNVVAIDYIWQRFSENYIAENSIPTLQEVGEIQKSLHHRSFNPESEQHQKFLVKLRQKIKSVEEKWQHIKF